MGAWGVKLDQNDIYADVRDLYTALLRCGLSDEDALNKTQEKFSAYAEDDNLLFRLSLADVMFRLGRLTNEVRDNALHIIDSGADLDTWYQSSQEQGDARRKVLGALKDQLCGEQPAKKKIGKKRYKKCSWKCGDIYRYTFTSETAEKYDMLGKYLFVQKIADYFVPDSDMKIVSSLIGSTGEKPGDIYPMIHIWISDDADFVPSPQNSSECIPTMWCKQDLDDSKPLDHRFYILNFPGKSSSFEFVCNTDPIFPDKERFDALQQSCLKPKHLTWKFFEKHVIGRYMFWTKHIDIFR